MMRRRGQQLDTDTDAKKDPPPPSIVPSSEDDDDSDPLLVQPSSEDDDDDPSKKKKKKTVNSSPVCIPPVKYSNNNNTTTTAFRNRFSATLLRWLRFYVRYLQSSPFHQDRILKALQWTTWLASAVALEKRQTKAAAILSKLSVDLSFARYATRLLEWPTALEAAWTGSWTTRSITWPRLFEWFGRALSWSMVGYYPTEHMAYVLWMLPSQVQNPKYSRLAAQYSAVSCRFWMVYLVAEIMQCVVQLQQQQPNNEESKDKAKHVRLQLLRDSLFLLPCIHWSLPDWDTKPWLPSKIVNGLMWVEAMVSLYQTGRTVKLPED